jgi:hypothetical protein
MAMKTKNRGRLLHVVGLVLWMGLTGFARGAIVLATALALVSGVAQAEIVDTLAGFDEDTVGVSGALGAGISANGGNTETVSFSGSARVQWQQRAERIRFLAGSTYETARGVRTKEDLLLHVRHNHRLRSWVRSLLFAQLQRNPFQRLQSRTLLGAGARFEPVAGNEVDLTIGVAYMLEMERLVDVSGTNTEHRLSSFVTVAAFPREGVTIESTVFVQPRLDAFEDVRVAGQASIRSRVIGPVSLAVSATYLYDRKPPEEVAREDWSIKSGLQLTL